MYHFYFCSVHGYNMIRKYKQEMVRRHREKEQQLSCCLREKPTPPAPIEIIAQHTYKLTYSKLASSTTIYQNILLYEIFF